MTIDRWLTFGSILIALMAVLLNWKRGNSLDSVDGATSAKTMNEAIDLANKRALNAEQLYSKGQDEIFLLEKRVKALETEIKTPREYPYHLTFDVIFTDPPQVNNVEIQRIAERRKQEVSVDQDRRNK